jgi:hypothetical protein
MCLEDALRIKIRGSSQFECCYVRRWRLAKSANFSQPRGLTMTNQGLIAKIAQVKKTKKKKNKKKKTALIICQDHKNFWTTQAQFWQWIREGVIVKTQDEPLTGAFIRENEELFIVARSTVLNLAHPHHMREALISRRLGLGQK